MKRSKKPPKVTEAVAALAKSETLADACRALGITRGVMLLLESSSPRVEAAIDKMRARGKKAQLDAKQCDFEREVGRLRLVDDALDRERRRLGRELAKLSFDTIRERTSELELLVEKQREHAKRKRRLERSVSKLRAELEQGGVA
jgi:predicted  nucleic acid-binding Zn-ribbon protein